MTIWPLDVFIEESNRIEGIHRGPLSSEIDAYMVLLQQEHVTIPALQAFVSVIRHGAILRDTIGLDVQIGDYLPPLGGPEVVHELRSILARVSDGLDPHQVHLDYENLHPFTDGNGRSGRVLWLKMMGGKAPLGFLHEFYYQTLRAAR